MVSFLTTKVAGSTSMSCRLPRRYPIRMSFDTSVASSPAILAPLKPRMSTCLILRSLQKAGNVNGAMFDPTPDNSTFTPLTHVGTEGGCVARVDDGALEKASTRESGARRWTVHVLPDAVAAARCPAASR
jgi:hypothetical protein